MMKLIDAVKAEKIMRHAFCECCDDHNGFKCPSCSVQEVIEMFKAEDNVIRCQECKYATQATINSNGFVVCHASGMEITMDDYCSYAERA